MKTYLEAYGERLERNDKALKEIALEVIKTNSDVEVYFNHNKNFKDSVLFFKGEMINSIGFHEVPYRWSGCGYQEFDKYHSGGENSAMPFTVEDVLNTFHPVTEIKLRQPDEYCKSKEQYLKWYSFYKRWEETNNE